MNPNIYMLMEWRGYEFVSAIVIEADKRIKSYKKIVEDYLCQFKADVNYFYMYYVSYPKELLREKEVLIFKKKFVINDEECIIDE